MTVSKRDTQRHTYADYRVWSREYGDELIDGTAYVREPQSPVRAHQEIVGEIHRQIANADNRSRTVEVHPSPYVPSVSGTSPRWAVHRMAGL